MKGNVCNSCNNHVNEADLTRLPFGRVICSECMRKECEEELKDLVDDSDDNTSSWNDVFKNYDDDSDDDDGEDNVSLHSIGSYIRGCNKCQLNDDEHDTDCDDDDDDDFDDGKSDSTLTNDSSSTHKYTIDDLIRLEVERSYRRLDEKKVSSKIEEESRQSTSAKALEKPDWENCTQSILNSFNLLLSAHKKNSDELETCLHKYYELSLDKQNVTNWTSIIQENCISNKRKSLTDYVELKNKRIKFNKT